ncbi:hypothetical protein KIN20_011743 [Parelaphostrongylus tenuis]|uniref:Uncharacterized protein n=1 Tax=Parelaphostrongylus tenuis TaxID=148309 RepID=A0AAD5QJX3_PARTN|nr:hypothetical protein KIN20_011743 [Parelaphostrongylus tenuis]
MADNIVRQLCVEFRKKRVFAAKAAKTVVENANIHEKLQKSKFEKYLDVRKVNMMNNHDLELSKSKRATWRAFGNINDVGKLQETSNSMPNFRPANTSQSQPCFGCGVIPGGQTSTRTFTASGPSNLPIIAVYTDKTEISALIPGIATSKGVVQALAQRFAMQTVVDVLEIEGRRALLPDFVISNILGQLRVNTTYEPLRCQLFMEPGKQQLPMESCIYVGSTVTGICPGMAPPRMECAMIAKPINSEHLSLSRTLTTTNIIMANWSRSMWQNVVDRALRMLRSGPFGSHLYTVTVTVS